MNEIQSVVRGGTAAVAVAVAVALVVSPAAAGTRSAPVAAATFIDSSTSSNHFSSGACNYLMIGNDGVSIDVALVRFNVPNLAGRAVVGSVSLAFTLRPMPGDANTDPYKTCGTGINASYALDLLGQSWNQGDGCGAQALFSYAMGSACTTGASWTSPDCVGTWTAGGNATPVIGLASSGTTQQYCANQGGSWCSAVQSWTDGASNFGFRVRSTASATGMCHVQYFEKNPTLSFTYTCRAGFEDTGTSCTSCGTTNQANCAASATGNSCADTGASSAPGYACTCNNAAYAGTGTTSCANLDECATTNPCAASGDGAAQCTDRAAPATGHQCTCSTGFSVTSQGTSSATCVAAATDAGASDAAGDANADDANAPDTGGGATTADGAADDGAVLRGDAGGGPARGPDAAGGADASGDAGGGDGAEADSEDGDSGCQTSHGARGGYGLVLLVSIAAAMRRRNGRRTTR